MKPFIITILSLFILSCSSNYFSFTEENLFDKVFAASESKDSNNLSDSDLEQILLYISKGKVRWIDLYKVLSKEPFLSVAFFQEGLKISMAYALPERPSEVLKFVDESNIKFICGIPFIEPSQSEVNSYYLKTTTALKNTTFNEHWKNKCLTTLNETMSRKNQT